VTTRCSICRNSEVTAIDADLLRGESIRATARRWLVSRSALARHSRHVAGTTDSAPPPSSRDQLQEALDLLERADTERERLRGLEAVRSALRLELREHKPRPGMRKPTDEQLDQLQSNLEQSWLAYEGAKDASHDRADRSLAGVRSAVDSLRAAEARASGGAPVNIVMKFAPIGAPHDCDGPGPGVNEQTRSFCGIPDQFGWPPYHSTILLSVTPGTGPDVEVCDGSGRIVWENLHTRL
jgi:hypothetical protein